jgi:Fe-Mn family superoxide dismutase
MIFSKIANQDKMPFILPDLPYSKDAFLPHLSVENFDYHHGKHHNAYVTNLNKLIIDNVIDVKTTNLEDLILECYNKPHLQGAFNNAAQIWNHSFYWHSMSPNKSDRNIDSKLITHIEKDFDSLEKFHEEFTRHGLAQFGSGWVWLVLDTKDNKLEIIKTSNADTPICHNKKPLLVCDLWEHAYYIDYRNNRANYLKIFLEHLVNWNFALINYLS